MTLNQLPRTSGYNKYLPITSGYNTINKIKEKMKWNEWIKKEKIKIKYL